MEAVTITWKPWARNACSSIGEVDGRFFLAEARYGGGDPRTYGANPLENLIGFRIREVQSRNGRFLAEVATVGPNADEVHAAIVDYLSKNPAKASNPATQSV